MKDKNSIWNPVVEMPAPQCTKCSRFDWDHTCLAFPSGIPDEIFLGEFDHKEPYPGDDGFMFIKSGTNSKRGTNHEISRSIDRES